MRIRFLILAFHIALLAGSRASAVESPLCVNISRTEMVLFELLKTADHPHFKQIAKLIK